LDKFISIKDDRFYILGRVLVERCRYTIEDLKINVGFSRHHTKKRGVLLCLYETNRYRNSVNQIEQIKKRKPIIDIVEFSFPKLLGFKF